MGEHSSTASRLAVMQILHQGGGAGSVTSALHLSLGLARTGWHVRFVCPPRSEVARLAIAGGLEVHPFEFHPRRHLRNARRLARLLGSYPVHLVNSQSSRDRKALTLLALTRRLKVPFVATRRQMPRTAGPENWLTSRLAARMIAVSPAVAAALRQRGTPAGKVELVPNGLVTARVDAPVSAAELERWRRRIEWGPDRRTVGIVSRRKDQRIVLEALGYVQTPVRLVLAGVDDPGRLSELIRRVPARHAVVCLPFSPDIRPLYDLLDLVLLPSRMEGFSQALLEGMALGKPVLASAAAGNLDLIHDGVDGCLVPPLDPAAWAAAIDRLLGDPSLCERLGTAARATARECYSLDRTVERTAAVYRDVLRCSRAPAPPDFAG
jgi:glycosyltransferase involved in cell wall biosynthesis